MHAVLKAQLEFQTAIGCAPESFSSGEDKMRYIRDMCLGLNVEVAEFLQEMPWKPWRPLADQKFDKFAAAEEITDMMIFVLNLWIHLGAYTKESCADELIKRITHKQVKNMARLRSGRNRSSK